MDYGRIVSRSFEIAWEHKWLWIFGIFAAGMGLNLRIEYLLGISPTNPMELIQLMLNDPDRINAVNSSLYPISIFSGLITVFALGSIIDSVNRIERGGIFSFSTAFSAGVDNYLKLFGLSIIFITVSMAYVFFISLFITFLFAINMLIGGLSLLIIFPVTLFIFFSLLQILMISLRVVVIRNVGIIESISEGFTLLKMHFGKNIAVFFIFIAFLIGFGIITFVIWFILSFPIDIVIQAMNLKAFAAMMTAMFLGLPVTYLLGGFIGLFYTTFMTLFYIELVDPKPESAYFPETAQSAPPNDNTPLI